MDADLILHLLAKKIGNTASQQELATLKEILIRHPEFSYLNELLDAIESDKQHREFIEGEKLITEGWSALKDSLEDWKSESDEYQEEIVYPWVKKQHRFLGTFFRYAAVAIGIITLVGSGFFFLKRQDRTPSALSKEASSTRIIKTGPEAPRKNMLPDGSVVWLNAGSYIRYVKDSMQKNRQVFLEGEAYFDVKHDAEHPFIVHAGNVEIKVLGTSFNVHAYKNDKKVETTLFDGKIKVQMAGNPDKSFVLRPNERLTIAAEMDREIENIKTLSQRKIKEVKFRVEELPRYDTVVKVPEVAWMEDKLAFENETFEQLAKSLERRYGVQLLFKTPSLKQERLSGVFKNENIQKALEILQMTTPFHYKIAGEAVYLSGTETEKKTNER